MTRQVRSKNLLLTQPTKSDLEKADKYAQTAKRYYANSREIFKKGELDKAGELLSGAVAQMAKALATKDYGDSLKSHNRRRDFFRQLHLMYHDLKLQTLSESADDLHTNYYENFLERPRFLRKYSDAEYLYSYLSDLLYMPKKH